MILTTDPENEFTLREQQIVYLVAKGMSNKEIAFHLSLSEQTVKAHIANMTAKTGVDNRAALVAYGFESGTLKGE